MLKFNEEQQIKDIRGALALRSDVEKVVDQVWTKGFDAVYYLGIGGTYASAMQAVTYANGKSNLPIYVQHAAEYYTTGNKRLTEKIIRHLVFRYWDNTRSGASRSRNQKGRRNAIWFY